MKEEGDQKEEDEEEEGVEVEDEEEERAGEQIRRQATLAFLTQPLVLWCRGCPLSMGSFVMCAGLIGDAPDDA